MNFSIGPTINSFFRLWNQPPGDPSNAFSTAIQIERLPFTRANCGLESGESKHGSSNGQNVLRVIGMMLTPTAAPSLMASKKQLAQV